MIKGVQITQHIQKRTFNKMDTMISINTSTVNNPFCMSMRKKEKTICKSCYAYILEKMYKGVTQKYGNNGMLLSERIIPLISLPFINHTICRFHSTGELINDTHYINFQNIAKKNGHCLFTLWTKRIDIVHKNFKPIKNLLHIYSSPILNVQSEKPKYFNKVFTVYSAKHIRENEVEINCKGKCIDCLLCYSKNKTIHIHEKLR